MLCGVELEDKHTIESADNMPTRKILASKNDSNSNQNSLRVQQYESRLEFLDQCYFKAPIDGFDYPIMVLLTEDNINAETETALLEYLSEQFKQQKGVIPHTAVAKLSGDDKIGKVTIKTIQKGHKGYLPDYYTPTIDQKADWQFY